MKKNKTADKKENNNKVNNEASNVETVEKEIDLEAELQAIIQKKDMEIEAIKESIKDREEKLLRSTAEMLNKQKRDQVELEKQKKYALNSIVNDMLSVVDNLERTLQVEKIQPDVQKGIEMTLKELIVILKNHGVEVINPEKNAKFNAEKHHAISQIETKDQENNTIIEVVQKGYSINNRLLRAAMVVVSK